MGGGGSTGLGYYRKVSGLRVFWGLGICRDFYVGFGGFWFMGLACKAFKLLGSWKVGGSQYDS